MHRDSGSAHVRRREAHELARGHVILAVPVVPGPTLAVADGEPDHARALTWLDKPLPARGNDALGREQWSCQEGDQEKDGEPHGNSGSGFRELDGRGAPRVARVSREPATLLIVLPI